jgi:xanthine dehydrogenase small subunit
MTTLRFTLNGRPVAVDDPPPTTTLLDWLRAPKPRGMGLTGSKEGCAEGDCGACSVAILDRDPDGAPAWRAVDACLVLLPQLAGQEIVTVEGLARGDTLHPAQVELVERLGSQCGYCTPGFVMTLFEATYRPELAAGGRAAALRDDQLCGNLCRCTGYRPIRDALDHVAGTCPNDRFSARLTVAQAETRGIAYATGTQRFAQPDSWPALWEAVEAMPDARFVHGATDLGLEVTRQHIAHPALVSLQALPGFDEVTRIPGGVRIGAGARLSWLEVHDVVPLLTRMLRFFASRQIKNRATLGGNLANASPIGDTPPVLLALDALVVLASRSGERRVPIDEFFLSYRKTALQPGEIVRAVEIPDPAPDARMAAYKVSKRRELDISAVAAGFRVELDGEGLVRKARLAYGGMAATPARARNAEAALVGAPFDGAAVDRAIAALDADFRPLTDHRGSSWYRATVAKNLLRAFHLEGRLSDLPRRPSGTCLSSSEAR